MSEMNGSDIAVVGMAGRFPGARDLSEFWSLLAEGREGVRDLSVDEAIAAGGDPVRVRDPNFVRSVSALDEPMVFDADFFGFSASQASITDPQVRVFLELVWAALEDAGRLPTDFRGNIGVYAGSSFSTYLFDELVPNLDGGRDALLTSAGMRAMVGTDKDYITTWVSYQLDLRGPSVAVYTACSTSLVAIHSAVSALLAGECDMALAGGIKVRPADMYGYLYEEGSLASPDGRCRSFDADALGTIFGHGGGVIVLRRLEDACRDGDRIRAIIRASAINNDGNAKVGFTAPGVRGQVEVISAALGLADLSADDISYVEAHGTGTAVGDPIEVSALTRAFRGSSRRRQYCALGSVKTNIGHLESGAGVAGFIKTVLALEHEQLPPSLNFKRPNPAIDFENSPFFVNTTLRPWPRGRAPRRAAVSSFGIGGTNAHIIVEEAPPPAPRAGPPERPQHLLCVSARNPAALDRQLARYADALVAPDAPDLGDAAFTANVGRMAMEQRAIVVGRDAAEIASRLRGLRDGEPGPGARRGRAGDLRVAFLYDGQGAGFPAMGADLYATCPPFRAEIDRLARVAAGHGLPDLVALLCDPARGDDLGLTLYAQPALAALELGLTALWKSWGLSPVAVLGHSLGEVVAASAAGIYEADDALGLVIARARAMHETAPGGGMIAVMGDEVSILSIAASRSDSVELAARNGPESFVLSGELGALAEISLALEAAGARVRRLNIGGAYHSRRMDAALPAIARAAQATPHSRPRLPLISNLTGQILQDPLAGWPDHWTRHARSPVRFAEGLESLRALGVDTLVEIGPGTALLGMAREALGEALTLPSLRKDVPAWETLLDSLGQLWVGGAEVDLAGLDAPWPRRRVALPTYAFDKKVHLPPPRRRSRPTLPNTSGHPLRGARLDTAVTLYEGRVDLGEQPWLADHVVGDQAILPGTAMLEIAGSACQELFGAFALRDVAFASPMPLSPDAPRAVQLAIDEERGFRLYSRVEGGTWEQHSSGGASADAALPEGSVLEAWRAECGQPLDPNLPYERLESRDIHFGARFKAVTALWRRPEDGSGRAVTLSRLRLPEGLSASGMIAHPVLLDGCFQTCIAGMPAERSGPPVVPVAIDQVRVRGPLPGVLWCRAELPLDFGGDGKADLRLCDEEGRVLVELLGLQGAVLSVSHHRDRLFQDLWRPAALSSTPPLPTPDDLRAALAVDAEAIAASLREIWGPEQESWLDAQVGWAAGNLLAGLDWPVGETREEAALARAVGVLDVHRRAFHRLLGILIEDGALRETGEALLRVGPWPARPSAERPRQMARPVLDLIEEAACDLPKLMRGDRDPLGLLFPDGSLGLVEEIYVRSSVATTWHGICARVIRALVERCPPGRALRVLEVGGGTGSTTGAVLAELPADRSSYLFTDISRHFLTRAEARFAAWPFLRTRLLDIDRSPDEQGFTGEHYDLVIANNVLHATTDLRATLRRVHGLLAPGGLVLIAEAVRPHRWTDITFGLTEGWWRFQDDLRTVNPIASVEAWCRALRESGFDQAGQGLADEVAAADTSNHTVLVARAVPRLATLGRPILEEAPTITPEQVGALPPGTRLILGPLLDAPLTEDPAGAAASVARARVEILELALRAAQALPATCRMQVVTRGANSVAGEAVDPAQAALWALGQVLRNELRERFVGLVDLPLDAPVERAADALRAELSGPGDEPRVALRAERLVKRIHPYPEPTQAPWSPRADGTCLITGGLGGIGLRLSRWLAADGAGAVVLLGRSAPDPEAAAELERQRASGARVEVWSVDVADPAALGAALERIRATLPPLRAVFHAAGLLDDALLPDMDVARFQRVLRPKVDGAWLLHTLTVGDPVEQFVLFGSGSSIYGTLGQANHAAGNGFLDGLARARRAAGRPAISVAWGRWSDVGVVRDAAIGERLEAQGLISFTADIGIDVLRRLMSQGVTHVLFSPTDRRRFRDQGDPLLIELLGGPAQKAERARAERWSAEGWARTPAEAREALVARWLQGQVAQLVGLGSAEDAALDQPLNAVGLDSLMAVELRGRLSRELGVPVSVGDLLAVGSLRESASRMHASLVARDLTEAAPVATEEWEEITL